ncbi:hypothetical protein BDV98DRAFT_563320 [Pterulicium gracile]|uniref:Hemerythrin-like domain-containing protein n=1 Tax=Pterulicium gracile TaxID=1884261 RepID=A0A5C3QUF3_9AGAR|nr:hypothetical protein BDV98DRAFT_563320 [Pterula gracilis]
MPAPYPFIPIPPGSIDEPFEHNAINMAAAHNVFVQGINAIVHHAPNITPEKVDPFMTFCMAVFESIHHHHSVEEAVFFPEIEAKLGKGAMSGNIDEHHLFVPQLAEFEEYLGRIKKGEEKYDGGVLLERLNGFTDVMLEHLNHEVETLDPARLRAAFTARELKVIGDKVFKAAMSDVDYHIVMPLVMVSLNPATPWFPPIPLPVRWAIRFYFSWKHADAWEFGAVDFRGRPRLPLPASK